MKRTAVTALVTVLLLFTLTACTGKTGETTAPPPSTTEPVTEPTTAPRAKVSEQDITVKATPVSLAERPEFEAKNKVAEDEFVSLHGYKIGMTFAQTQQIWQIPQEMIDYAVQRIESSELTSLYIFVGNMAYDFVPAADASNYGSYILRQIYYGETIFCENREQLSVLRDIKLGDMIGDALKSLPGSRTPKKWAIDQLYGEYGKPNSASLEYTTKSGFYELRIHCENSWIRLAFGSSGKLWIAEVHAAGN